MTIGFIAVSILLQGVPKVERRTSVLDLFRALRRRGLLSIGIMALFYNFGFFTILAYTPYALPRLTAQELGFVYFGWGVLLAICSVFSRIIKLS